MPFVFSRIKSTYSKNGRRKFEKEGHLINRDVKNSQVSSELGIYLNDVRLRVIETLGRL